MEETKKLAIPDGYEFDRVEGGEVILKRASTALPKDWNEIIPSLGEMDFITASVPDGMGNATRIFCHLICARNAWWKQLGWKPDWKNKEDKYCITSVGGEVSNQIFCSANSVLAFPTREVRDQFYEAFKDLIEEAKELL